MILEEMNDKELNIYRNLQQQKERHLAKGKECAISTRRRYNDGIDLFLKVMAIEYSKRNILKIKNNHLERVVEVLQEAGYTPSTVANTMSAVRYFYNKAIGKQFKIKDNRALGVIPRGKKDRIDPNRALTEEEFNDLKSMAYDKGREDYVLILDLGKVFGLRIHECYKMRASIAKAALDSGRLCTVGKGGLKRWQNLDCIEKRILIQSVLDYKQKGDDRIFVHDNDTHLKIKNMQRFVSDYRDQIQEEGRYKITFHSLRHNYAQTRFKELRAEGSSITEAKFYLSKELGHSRLSVCDIYLTVAK